MAAISSPSGGSGKRRGRRGGEPEGAVDLMGAPFPAARGCQGAKLAGGDAHGAPLTAPSRRKAYEHESEGAAVGRRVCADRVDFSVSSVSPLVARNLRSWAEPLERSGR